MSDSNYVFRAVPGTAALTDGPHGDGPRWVAPRRSCGWPDATRHLSGYQTTRFAKEYGRLVVQMQVSNGEAPRAGTSARRIRVLLVEDHTSVRQALATAFQQEEDFEAVAQAGSVAEAREMLEDVDVAIIDLGLPDGYGGDLISGLRETSPDAQTLVLSANLDRAQIARAVQSGASAALDKTAALDDVVTSVRRLRAGETLLPLSEVVDLLRFAASRREQEFEDRQAIARLTPREREVLQALAGGLDSRAIADRLHISVRTESNHIANILAKLGVHSRLQALVFALRYGLVEIT